jgi:predicted small secreted protein
MRAVKILFLFLFLALGGAMTTLTACETMQNAWEDVRDTVD